MNLLINKDFSPLSRFDRQLCNIQGKMFELSAEKNFESESFINFYMNSKTAQFFDLPYDRTQWLGETNLLQDIIDENPALKTGETYDKETLYWTGYLYRYWHFLTNEQSKDIVKECDAKTMRQLFPAYHTLDCEAAIKRIKEAKCKS